MPDSESPRILGVKDRGNGTHELTVAAVGFRQSQVVLIAGALDDPGIAEVLRRVADPHNAAMTIPRRSARQDRNRRG